MSSEESFFKRLVGWIVFGVLFVLPFVVLGAVNDLKPKVTDYYRPTITHYVPQHTFTR